jgi:molybdopterin converting factor small subunit
MNIRIRILPWFSGLVGGEKDEEIEFDFMLPQNSTMQQFLDETTIQRPDIARLIYDEEFRVVRDSAVIILNNRVFELCGGYEKLLNDEDVIALMPAYSGG